MGIFPRLCWAGPSVRTGQIQDEFYHGVRAQLLSVQRDRYLSRPSSPESFASDNDRSPSHSALLSKLSSITQTLRIAGFD